MHSDTDAGELLLVVEQRERVDVAVADVAKVARLQATVLKVLGGLLHEAGELGDGDADELA